MTESNHSHTVGVHKYLEERICQNLHLLGLSVEIEQPVGRGFRSTPPVIVELGGYGVHFLNVRQQFLDWQPKWNPIRITQVTGRVQRRSSIPLELPEHKTQDLGYLQRQHRFVSSVPKLVLCKEIFLHPPTGIEFDYLAVRGGDNPNGT